MKCEAKTFTHIGDKILASIEARLDRVSIWTKEHPGCTKILIVASIILAIGALVAAPLAIPLGVAVVTTLAVVGSAHIVGALILLACYKKKSPPNPKIEPPPSKPISNSDKLWETLQAKSSSQLRGLACLANKEVNHRAYETRCPKKTAVQIDGKYLHANQLEEKTSLYSITATQAPLKIDLALFWKGVFNQKATVIDLTQPIEQVSTPDSKKVPVDPYYPTKLNDSVEYGNLKVTLAQISGNVFTYEIEDLLSKKTQQVQRLHYTNWLDRSTISLSDFHQLITQTNSLASGESNNLWIHCRAGIGRTGALIVGLLLKEKIKEGKITSENLETSLVDLIIELRKQRGHGFLQEKSQFNLLINYAKSILEAQTLITSENPDIKQLTSDEIEALFVMLQGYFNKHPSIFSKKTTQEIDSLTQSIVIECARSEKVYGPVIRAFVDHLLKTAESEDKKLVFMARDGIPYYKAAVELMKTEEYQQKYPKIAKNKNRLNLAYLSKKVINQAKTSPAELKKFHEYMTQLGLEDKDKCLFVDIGFSGSMAKPIQNLLPNIEIDFKFLISTKTTKKVEGFLATPTNRLTNLRESADKNGIKKGAAWLEASHAGTIASPTSLEYDEKKQLHPNSLYPIKMRPLESEKFSTNFLLRKFCQRRAICGAINQKVLDLAPYRKTFNEVLGKINSGQIVSPVTYD